MIRIAYDADGDFCVVEGHEEFFELMDKRGMAEVVDVATGTNYFAHEVGEQIFLLNGHAQDALVRLADVLIREIAAKPLH
ncbi:hypothetical protein Q8A64_10880 [Oxalobacteraceae bacterium R-40]|uniref:Uncharacterized protein n=1 Tax=Keguizhuia sedimenti TaxID=3064264 RepID=A0ABU1BS57_9BURK|nr:hypothetical protein [Oxalobacteraceae bacterium R-40]